MQTEQLYGKRKLDDKRGVLLFFWIVWVSYASVYFGRLNFSACINDMSAKDGFLLSDLGGVAAIFYLAYGVGQLVSGILGDRISAKWLVFTGIISSACINLIFAFQRSILPMMILWCLNGFFQSLIWPPIVKLCSDRLTGAQCGKTCVDLCTTGPVGMLAVYGLCAFLISAFSWRASFVAAFLIMACSSALWLFGVSKMERYADRRGIYDDTAKIIHESQVAARGKFLPIALASGLIFVMASTVINGMLKDGITTWTPTFLAVTFRLDAGISTGLTTLLPVINLAGVYLARTGNQKLFRNELGTASAFFGLTALAVMGNILAGDKNLFLAIGFLAASTSAMTGVNTLLTGLVPLYYRASNRVSLVTGLLNSTVYIGSAAASYLFGAVAQLLGWQANRILWLVLAVLGVMLCLLGARRWKRFVQVERH